MWNGVFMDKNKSNIKAVCDAGPVIHLVDFTTKRGNRRNGFFSTLLTWEKNEEKVMVK